MKREEVYNVINHERNYQDSFVKENEYNEGQSFESVSAEMVMMKTYLDKAFHEWTHNKGEEKALHELRKVVALGVRCFENNGVPKRKRLGY